jgi:hypothetical protein
VKTMDRGGTPSDSFIGIDVGVMPNVRFTPAILMRPLLSIIIWVATLPQKHAAPRRATNISLSRSMKVPLSR